MNARQAKWIVEKLCPFILREHGRGFAMEYWNDTFVPGAIEVCDEVKRKIPKCGTVCCIGGSIAVLKRNSVQSVQSEAKLIGLSEHQGNVLFLGWQSWGLWPDEFKQRYKKAKTPIAKARVAVSLLKLVAKTRGGCLENLPDHQATDDAC